MRCLSLLLPVLLALGVTNCASANNNNSAQETTDTDSVVIVGAERTELYLDSLRGRKVALFSNHTGVIGDSTHTVDMLLDNGINVAAIFSPEHGFSGKADAGEHVSSSEYSHGDKTVPVVSLYGPGHAKAMKEALANGKIDIILVDIQDVGLRYYTYYCTMIELQEEAARNGQKFIVLDRPNPNGMYVDGPILDMKYKSGVGKLPIPTVHGLTLGELAQMVNGEYWLADSLQADLTVVPCANYTHQTRYQLPVAPSPNLSTMKAIYLYPSLCYFEGTKVSLGRGTDKPFLIYGHPDMKEGHDFTFTPRSVPGAQNPPLLDQLCYGTDLSGLDDEEIIAAGINLDYVIDAYRTVGGDDFFTSFFELLMGRGDIRAMIESGADTETIKKTWADDVKAFLTQRRPYLLYNE